jgi:hypothetical protein
MTKRYVKLNQTYNMKAIDLTGSPGRNRNRRENVENSRVFRLQFARDTPKTPLLKGGCYRTLPDDSACPPSRGLWRDRPGTQALTLPWARPHVPACQVDKGTKDSRAFRSDECLRAYARRGRGELPARVPSADERHKPLEFQLGLSVLWWATRGLADQLCDFGRMRKHGEVARGYRDCRGLHPCRLCLLQFRRNGAVVAGNDKP